MHSCIRLSAVNVTAFEAFCVGFSGKNKRGFTATSERNLLTNKGLIKSPEHSGVDNEPYIVIYQDRDKCNYHFTLDIWCIRKDSLDTRVALLTILANRLPKAILIKYAS